MGITQSIVNYSIFKNTWPNFQGDFHHYSSKEIKKSLTGNTIDLTGHLDLPPTEVLGDRITLRPYVNGYLGYFLSDHRSAFDALNNPIGSGRSEKGRSMKAYTLNPGLRIMSNNPFVGGYLTLDLGLNLQNDPIKKRMYGFWPDNTEARSTDMLLYTGLSNEFQLPYGTRLRASANAGINVLEMSQYQWSAETTIYNNLLWRSLGGVDPYLTIGTGGGKSNTYLSNPSLYFRLGLNF